MAKPSPSHAGHPFLVALGKQIRSTRQEQGLSQETVALMAGIDRSYMGGIERGEHNISLINLLRISTVLNLPMSDLIRKSKH